MLALMLFLAMLLQPAVDIGHPGAHLDVYCHPGAVICWIEEER